MKDFWLFRPFATGLTPRRKALFWTWNGAVLLLAGLSLGALSLLFAYGTYAKALMKSYFEHPLIAVLNILPVLLLLLLLYGVFGRPWAAFLGTSVVVGGLSLANYYLLRCRDDPLMFEDIKYLREAGAITQNANYDLSPDKRIWFGLLCIVAGTLFLKFLVRGVPRWQVRLGLGAAGVVCCVAVAGVYADDDLYDNGTQNFDYINRWSATQLYVSKGFLYPFLHSITVEGIEPPEDYDEEATEALLESYAPADIPEDRKVDLITIQLEAFADFSRFENVEGIDWESAYAAYHALEAESLSGDLITNIFAGGTVDTERAFLTGYGISGQTPTPMAGIWTARAM